MLENISLAFQGIWGHKLRSFLTMLGIIIGIASIVTIVSTIKGTNDLIKQNLIGAGNNAVKVQLYQNDYPYDMSYSPIPEGVKMISEETRQAIADLDGIEAASLYHSRDYAEGIYYENTMLSGSIYGIDAYYLDVYGYRLVRGRSFTQTDYERGRKVALVDEVTVSTLFNGEDPVGKTIEIMFEPFAVVGVIAQDSSFRPKISNLNDYYMYSQTSGGRVFLPDSTWPVIYRFDEPQNVVVQASSTEGMTKAGDSASELLTSTQILAPEGGFSYKSEDLLGQAKQLQDLSTATNRQLIWIAGISLLVGGIGVMNIMLVSVTERTGEIGLKKAIGARKRRILWQFLTEAAALTSIGGIIGVLAGIGLAAMMSMIAGTPMSISIPAIIVSVVFSMVIGIVFGLLPAVKASNLNPIDALRRD